MVINIVYLGKEENLVCVEDMCGLLYLSVCMDF